MAEERAQRRLAAILAADVVGYSRLMEADEAGTLADLKSRRKEVLEPLLARYQGRIFKITGDGVLVEFGSPINAVQCAVELQRGMAAANGDLPEDRHIALRVGINLGDVMIEGGDRYGDGVNIAARLEAIAAPGGILVSGTTYDHVRNKVDADFEDLGAQSLKNILQPVRIYRITGTPRVSVSVSKTKSDKPSIAVLPFANMSGDPEQEYFSDGITEDIITDLTRFRDLEVIAHNSTAAYKGRPVSPRQIGQELNVRYVVEGSIQRRAGQIRVTSQLIDATTGATLWSDRWDRPDKDIFAIQSEVAEAIAATLGGVGGSAAIMVEETRKARRRPPASLTAYDYYLLAIAGRTRFTKDSVFAGLSAANKAIELDPDLGCAYAARAWLIYLTGVHFGGDYETAMQAMERDANQALALDPYDAQARITLAFYLGARGRYQESDAQIDAALRANPSNPQVLLVAASELGWHGRPEEGAALADRVMRLLRVMTPENLNCIKDAYFFARRFEDTIAVVSRIPLEARGRGARLMLTLSYALLGRANEAAQARAELLKNYPTISAELVLNTGGAMARPQEENLVLEGFRAAGLPLCASQAELAPIPNPRRLPQCVESAPPETSPVNNNPYETA
jgi:TolB-like protein/class 3 adenylate cyclase